MKRFLIAAFAAACLVCVSNPAARAGDCCEPCQPCCQPSGHWWHIFHHKDKCCLTCEEKRLQDFWHDYYCALSQYYHALDKIDWVAYYKNHGYQINTGCGGGCGPCGGGCERINYAPVFVSPTMQWAIPSGGMGAPGGCGPCGGPQGCCGGY